MTAFVPPYVHNVTVFLKRFLLGRSSSSTPIPLRSDHCDVAIDVRHYGGMVMAGALCTRPVVFTAITGRKSQVENEAET
jgi:hypothetical protein